MTEICILGAGHQGLAMAAHLALNGEKINMWNRTASHIDVIAKTNQINCSGVVQGIGYINKCSDNISDVISDIVMVTTPSSAHKDLARLLSVEIGIKDTEDHGATFFLILPLK